MLRRDVRDDRKTAQGKTEQKSWLRSPPFLGLQESDEKNEGTEGKKRGKRDAQKRLSGSGRRYPKEQNSQDNSSIRFATLGLCDRGWGGGGKEGGVMEGGTDAFIPNGGANATSAWQRHKKQAGWEDTASQAGKPGSVAGCISRPLPLGESGCARHLCQHRPKERRPEKNIGSVSQLLLSFAVQPLTPVTLLLCKAIPVGTSAESAGTFQNGDA